MAKPDINSLNAHKNNIHSSNKPEESESVIPEPKVAPTVETTENDDEEGKEEDEAPTDHYTM